MGTATSCPVSNIQVQSRSTIRTSGTSQANNTETSGAEGIANAVLRFGLPVILTAALAYQTRKNAVDRAQQSSRYEQHISRLQVELDAVRRSPTSTTAAAGAGVRRDGSSSSSVRGASTTPFASNLRLLVEQVETAEDEKADELTRELRKFERLLERIEDAECSKVRLRAGRTELQNTLYSRLDTGILNGIACRRHLEEIFKYDPMFCAKSTKEEKNGKLRQLYVRQWKLQTRLNKYRNIVDTLKGDYPITTSPPSSSPSSSSSASSSKS